jgi:hypothetical protein
MRRIIVLLTVAAMMVVTTLVSAPLAFAAPHPTKEIQCKNGNFAIYGFENQGQCISFLNNGGTLD